MKSTLHLLERTINVDKITLEIMHIQLVDIIDIQEKNEMINLIEELTEDVNDYMKTIGILRELEGN